MKKLTKSDYWQVAMFILLGTIGVSDYLMRSPQDIETPLEVCGKLKEAERGSWKATTSSVIVRLVPQGSTKKIVIKLGSREYSLALIEQTLAAHLNKDICISYVEPPLLIFFKYPIEVYSAEQIIIPKKAFIPNYLDNASLYWATLLGTGFMILLTLCYRGGDNGKKSSE